MRKLWSWAPINVSGSKYLNQQQQSYMKTMLKQVCICCQSLKILDCLQNNKSYHQQEITAHFNFAEQNLRHRDKYHQGIALNWSCVPFTFYTRWFHFSLPVKDSNMSTSAGYKLWLHWISPILASFVLSTPSYVTKGYFQDQRHMSVLITTAQGPENLNEKID